MSNYDDLIMDENFGGSEPVDPKDEKFHSIYIAGQERTADGITEEIGKIQIRGVAYNLPEVYIVLTHVKRMLVKETYDGKRSKLACFSYQYGPQPYHGTYQNKQCGNNKEEREKDDFCKNCKQHIIAAGIICDKNGKPKTGPDKQPIYGFIRGKGIKYGPLSEYLNDLFKMTELPVINADNEASDKTLNRSKVVTKISKQTTDTQYGKKLNFRYEVEKVLDKQSVEIIIKASMKAIEDFHTKFDWSRKKKNTNNSSNDNGVRTFEPEEEIGETSEKDDTSVSFADLEI